MFTFFLSKEPGKEFYLCLQAAARGAPVLGCSSAEQGAGCEVSTTEQALRSWKLRSYHFILKQLHEVGINALFCANEKTWACLKNLPRSHTLQNLGLSIKSHVPLGTNTGLPLQRVSVSQKLAPQACCTSFKEVPISLQQPRSTSRCPRTQPQLAAAPL